MAALAFTESTDRLVHGRYVQKTLRVGPTNATPGNAAEWVATGLSLIVAVVGHAVLGVADAGVNFVKNAQGTGVAEGTNRGDLGVESTLASTTLEVTVLGLL